jgi:hypothetical protein
VRKGTAPAAQAATAARATGEAVAENGGEAGPTALGRLPIVRRRREGDERRASLISRLLASF